MESARRSTWAWEIGKVFLKLCFPVSILSEQKGKLFPCVCVKKHQIRKAIYN